MNPSGSTNEPLGELALPCLNEMTTTVANLGGGRPESDRDERAPEYENGEVEKLCWGSEPRVNSNPPPKSPPAEAECGMIPRPLGTLCTSDSHAGICLAAVRASGEPSRGHSLWERIYITNRTAAAARSGDVSQVLRHYPISRGTLYAFSTSLGYQLKDKRAAAPVVHQEKPCMAAMAEVACEKIAPRSHATNLE